MTHYPVLNYVWSVLNELLERVFSVRDDVAIFYTEYRAVRGCYRVHCGVNASVVLHLAGESRVMYRYAAVVTITIGSLLGAYWFGYDNAMVKAERDALSARVESDIQNEVMIERLRVSDEALLIEQKRTAKVRKVETVKYVTKYRTKIVNSGKCVADSGLLDLLNASMPTEASTTN